MADTYRYVRDEHLPVEVLQLRVDPAHLDEFLRVDHEVWTLGEAAVGGPDRIPFLFKEVWLDDSDPGLVTIVFVWDSIEAWEVVGAPAVQAELQRRFDERFGHPVVTERAWHEESRYGLHRWSRFERVAGDAQSNDAVGLPSRP
jgi:uncharacterized protein (TIGR03792 family)